nr:YdcP family protein [Staphylococcus sp. MZ1]
MYAYKLASTGQGEQVTVKVPKEVELEIMSVCELVNVEAKQYVQSLGGFHSIQPSIKADDIRQIATIQHKKGAQQG